MVFVDFTTIGKKVTYKGKRGQLEGIVKNEVLLENNEGNRKFINLIQCIEFDGGGLAFGFVTTRRDGVSGFSQIDH